MFPITLKQADTIGSIIGGIAASVIICGIVGISFAMFTGAVWISIKTLEHIGAL